ncbi:MAG: D-galactarate dehydratase [Paenibacillus sp.]|nr:D-galactarate dehydratase [Paenibacillus sp.]
MAEHIHSGAEALVMDGKDHVATAIQDLQAGSTISIMKQGLLSELFVVETIPFGHKIAIEAIEEGTSVRKYGEVIGRATVLIPQGTHVHVHNVEGIRGRGDRAGSDQSAEAKGAKQV